MRRKASRAAVIVVLLVVVGCSSPGHLMAPSGSVFGTGGLIYTGKFFSVMAPARETRPVSIGSLELCATGDVIVTAISAAQAHGGLTITDWGHRPNPFATGGQMLGALPASLSSLGFSDTPVPMASGCTAPEGSNPEFAVQMARPVGSADASLTIGLRVSYTQGGASHTLDIPWTVGYCGSEASPAPGVTCTPS